MKKLSRKEKTMIEKYAHYYSLYNDYKHLKNNPFYENIRKTIEKWYSVYSGYLYVIDDIVKCFGIRFSSEIIDEDTMIVRILDYDTYCEKYKLIVVRSCSEWKIVD